MSEKKTPCIVYMRRRLSQPRANHFAHAQQVASEEALGERGFEVVGRYGDEEFAAPFAGHLEPRPAWQMALDAAAEICVTKGSCSLIVLRSDGIGDGDPFLPDHSLLTEYARVDIRVAQFSLRGDPSDTPLAPAHRDMNAFIEAERAEHFRQVIELGRSNSKQDLILRRDPFRKIVRAYYATHEDRSVCVRWQAYRKGMVQDSRWPRALAWEELEIPPRSAIHLQSFVQGDPSPQADWWRFKIGDGRDTKVGNLICTPQDLAAASLKVNWYSYEPEGLGPEDFHWEGAPRIETDRLVFRNWREEEVSQYDTICNSPEAMRFLGGQLSPQEVFDDLAYFLELGESGPTYWAIERKSDRQVVGFCGLLVVEEDEAFVAGEWEIGWRFASEAQGAGLAFEAASAVVQAAFEEWNLSRIVCRIHPANTASRRLAERLGLSLAPSCVGNSDPFESGSVLYFMTAEMFRGVVDTHQHWKYCRQANSRILRGYC